MVTFLRRPLNIIISAFSIATACVFPNVANATTFFGEDISAGQSFVPGGNAEMTELDFLSQLSGVSTESFESFSSGQIGPLNLTFSGSLGNINATLEGSNFVLTGSFSGVFPTDGTNSWVANGPFSIDFGTTEIAAFGFYLTDVEADPGLELTLDLVSGGQKVVTIPSTVPAPNGALSYFGIIDADNPFTKVTFSNATPSDGFGFDELTVGEVSQVRTAPEPSTLLGLGTLTLVGGTLLRRKRKA